ncbi:class I SAM-dependent methyltransferase [Ktedonobacter racemifer]|jgi:ubiquinone/menaquinone biosynthesis C-methylase UbiE|uniref:Methyltransferase type 11 n=1 Tax=Ktedonobacter racemifer DSM 44963 TaxID=485913 RepID=D6TJZ5_KTERA|nr:class I SAM-dependent methyltransferase [Ktedonobacter racemifer]EFH89752.1 Methyltransferase type 11 [Ktedonobacter racemifer DSM 44963]
MSLQLSSEPKYAPLPAYAADLLHASLYTAEDVQRLLERELLIQDAWGGGPLPASIFPGDALHVLDIGCGAGTWLMSMSQAYPHMHLVGVDRDASAISTAWTLNARHVDVRLYQCDAHNMGVSEGENASYDLVHMRFLASDSAPHQYAALLREAERLCRYGGLITVCEIELPISDCKALNQLMNLLRQALERDDRAFTSETSHQLGIMSWTQRCLQAFNCKLVQDEMFYIPCAYGSKGYLLFCQYLEQIIRCIKPLLICTQTIALEELDELEHEVRCEVASQKFYGLCPLYVQSWRRLYPQSH